MKKERGGRRLIYVSRSLIPKDNMVNHVQSMTQILKSARASNNDLGVTGMLLLHGTHFGQVLEGKVKALRKVMSRIKRDKRHADITILREEPLGQRVFSDWSMGLVTVKSPQAFRVTHHDDKDSESASPVDAQAQNNMIAEVREMVIAAVKAA